MAEGEEEGGEEEEEDESRRKSIKIVKGREDGKNTLFFSPLLTR